MPLLYQSPGPTREEIDATRGPLLLEFGTAWCGHCQLAAPAVEAALNVFPHVPHIQVRRTNSSNNSAPADASAAPSTSNSGPHSSPSKTAKNSPESSAPPLSKKSAPPSRCSTHNAHQTNQTAKFAKAAKNKSR